MEQRAPTPPADRIYTEAEYLQIETASPRKHEFRRGRIIAMAGGETVHHLIGSNICGELRNRLRQTPCLSLGSDARVRIARTSSYAYPDVTVVCDEPIFIPPTRTHTLVNPQVVVEVLSPSTTKVDLGEKLDDYLQIESLRQYVVVAQDEAWARSFVRDADGRWAFGPIVTGLDATIDFPSLDVGVPMAEVYAKVQFPVPTAAADGV